VIFAKPFLSQFIWNERFKIQGGTIIKYARIHILEAICHQLEKKLKYKKG